jgi:pyrroloquinoline quinone biosynthesis protein D
VTSLLSEAELEARLRDIGARRYHREHPFHHMLHGGKCTKGQVQAWALNRYYYQSKIPQKDANLIARCEDSDLRREWRGRLHDHDGENGADGGIERWLKLTDGLGLDREYVMSLRGLLPATRFAVDAYVNFVREKTLLEAVASCLTELFSPVIISERIDGMLKSYDFVNADTLAYFAKRPPQAERDSSFALGYVKQHARTPEQQAAVLNALEFKCGVLWSMLDALSYCYVTPGHIPPGAFVPTKHGSAVSDHSVAVAPIPADARPRLPHGVRLVHNEAHGGWVLLAPERVFKADAIAVEIIKRCTGEATMTEIVDDLAKRFSAPPGRVLADVTTLLRSLADKKLLDL